MAVIDPINTRAIKALPVDADPLSIKVQRLEQEVNKLRQLINSLDLRLRNASPPL